VSDDDERLRAIMAALERGSQPVVTPADAVAIAADLILAVEHAVERRTEAIAEQGATLACHAGCSECCHQVVGVWEGEAELIARYLRDPANAAIRERFLAAYPAWRAASRPTLDRLAHARDLRAQGYALAAHWRKRLMCPLNENGLCTIYEVRPTVCRTSHALGTSAGCVPDEVNGTEAEYLHFVPLERLVDRARVISEGVHAARRAPKRKPFILADTIADRLR
jgi:Fe-S-cluster containining protein